MYIGSDVETLAVSHFDKAELPFELSAIQRLEELLKRHFKTQKSLEFYSETLGISLRRLNAICLHHFRKTLFELIHERRFNESLKLLKHTALSVKEISYYLGFSDPPYFVRYFKKQTGRTPRRFRLLVCST